MNSTGIIIILIVIIICILVTLYINMYNKLTFSNIKINETEAQIDSKLRKKYDLINKSIAIIKNNIEEENKVFEEIIKLRSRKISNYDLDRKLAEATTEFFTIKEKNKDCELKKIKPHEFTQWTNFQGREDAEMLEEKSAGWSALKSSKGDYDAWDED